MKLPRPKAVVNAHTSCVTDYAADPNQPSWGLFLDALNRVNYLPAFVGGGGSDPSEQWFGDTQSPQAFKGLASLEIVAGTGDIIREGAFPQIEDAVVANSIGDTTRRAFLNRMRRGN